MSYLLTIFTLIFLQTSPPAVRPDTRAERLQQQRINKSANLQPPQRNSLEKVMYEFKERRILERYQAGFKGFHPMIGGLSTGSGWALGTQFQKADLWKGAMAFTASGQASLAAYQRYAMALDVPRFVNDRMSLSFNFTQRNFPQEDFFGIGSDSAEDNRSNFRLEDTDYSATLVARPLDHLSVGTRGGILNTNTASGTDKRFPSIEQRFNTDIPALERQPDYSYIGAFAQYDDRDEPLNPRSGGLYKAEGRYYHDRTFGNYSFRRWDFEVQRYFPFFNQRRVIAARSRMQLSDTNAGQEVPFFLLPTLGGSEDLRGFSEFRFRDRQSVVLNLEYRWEAFSGLDLALFGDAGKVYEHLDDIKWDELDTSYGFGFRFNSSKSVFLRMDIGFGHEGTHTFLKFGHVF